MFYMNIFFLLVLCSINSFAEGSLLAKVEFRNAGGQALAPEKGWVLLNLRTDSRSEMPVTELSDDVVRWNYKNGKMRPSLMLVRPGTKVTVESTGFRVPDFIFSDGRSVLRLDGRAKTKSRHFVMPGEFRVELSSFPGVAGRLFVKPWTHKGQPDSRGVFVLENIDSGSYDVWLLHPELPSFRELRLEILSTEITKTLLRFSESD
jgi:hypothetical protein